MGYEVDAWETFALGHLGASAALLGLVIVALSINLGKVIAARSLTDRAGEAVIQLFTVLTASTLVVVPGQGRRQVGIELLVLGAVVLGAVLVLQRSARGTPQLPVRLAFGLPGPLLLVVAGAALIARAGGGLAWWPPSLLFSYAAALLGAWVLLVEVLR